ncbi:MAG: type II toxin-antitoxin system VapC family toxin [Nitrospirae bacterium]|nr:type II toxin-antitoxin system VapC family toxin [Nitrospirota bacterium]
MNLPHDKAFCDTSFFFASLSPEDANYKAAGALLEYCKKHNVILYTTWDIISETVTLLRYRANYRMAVTFLDLIKPALFIIPYDDSVRAEAEKVFRKLSKDKRLSFCDAISYVVIAHLLEGIPCLTFDRDFRSLGLTVFPIGRPLPS